MVEDVRDDGLAVGFGVFPAALVEPVTRLIVDSVSCTSAFSQYAAIAALKGPWQQVTTWSRSSADGGTSSWRA